MPSAPFCLAFGLAWQLWAREEVENPQEEPAGKIYEKPEKGRSMTPEPSPAAPGEGRRSAGQADELQILLGGLEEMDKKTAGFHASLHRRLPLPPMASF